MFLSRLTIKKLLSFNDCTVELKPLNVLIGPNAVGKSNLIEAISLLQAAPSNINAVILRGGGSRQWLWLGDAAAPTATIESELNLANGRDFGPVTYHLQFADSNGYSVIEREELRWSSGNVIRSSDSVDLGPGAAPPQRQMGIPRNESLFSKIRYPADPTPITAVGECFTKVRIYRDLRTGQRSGMRYGIPTNVPTSPLEDGGDNLALVLNELDFLGVHEPIRENLRRFCERFEDVKIRVGENLARIYLREVGLTEMLSAPRMSDGTLKFLALLAALFHPKAPPLMCIEEPETGLHPDAMQLVADALVEASKSTQLIVTTHSEALVDWLSDRPDSVLVCERDFDNGTQMKRLSKDALKVWLERYTLGQLWRKGEIGGGRW
jgi:predicted ATPase